MSIRGFAFCALLALSSACGSDSEGEKPADDGSTSLKAAPSPAAMPWDEPPAAHLRLNLALEAGALSLVSATARTTPPPVSSLAGEYLAVAYSEETVVDAVALQSTSSERLVRVNSDGQLSEEELEAGSTTITAFLLDEPRVDRVVILDARGNVALEVDAAAISRISVRSLNVDSYPWINVIADSERAAELLPEGVRANFEAFNSPGPREIAAVEAGLAAMTEAARRAVVNIGFVSFPNRGASEGAGQCLLEVAKALRNSLFLNSDYLSDDPPCDVGDSADLVMTRTVVHEAVHNFTNLTAAVLDPDSLSQWPDEAVAIATDRANRYRMPAGLEGLIASIHDSGVSMELAVPYAGTASAAYADPKGPAQGFATPYGRMNAREDIAEFAAQIQLSNAAPAGVCDFFRGFDELNTENALAYTKALLLTHIGLIDEARFVACGGNLEISARPGMNLGGFALNGRVSGVLMQDGAQFFAVRAERDDGYSAMLRVLMPTGQPIGLHRLDNIGLANINSPNNAFYLSHASNLLKARTSATGLVVVTDAHSRSSEGVILFLVLRNAANIPTDFFPVSTWQVNAD